MIFEPDENQSVILNALERLVAPYRSVSVEDVVQRHVYSPDLQRALIDNGFLDIGVTDPDSSLSAALVVAEVARLPVAAEAAASALVRVALCPEALPPVALIWGETTHPIRFLAQAKTALLANETGVKLLALEAGDAVEVESIFAYPMARLTEAAAARARPLAEASVAELKRWWRIGLTLEMYGALDSAHKLTLEHVRDRQQFGRPLGSFQALQHRLAMDATSIEGMRWLAMQAAGGGSEADAALAAGYAQDACRTVIYDLHQFSGAMGLTLEYSLHLFTYRANFLQSQLGGAAKQAAAAADLIWADFKPIDTHERDTARAI